MSRRTINLVLILILFVLVILIAIPSTSQSLSNFIGRDLDTVLGLDLRGGLQVLMEVDLPEDAVVETQSLEDARAILENRSNGLGVSEVSFQIAGNRRIVGEFPGLTNTEEVIAVLKETGQLEFVELGSTNLPEGMVLKTDYGQTGSTDTTNPTETAPIDAPAAADAASPEVAATEDPTQKVWHTVMTGKDLKTVGVTQNQMNQYVISFELSTEGAKIFGDYTTNNVGKYLAIVLDKKIISAPVINSPITEGSGIIEGSFTKESANALSVQLRYGSLPIPLKVVESRAVGPTLGQDSIRKSVLAGLIGLVVIILFMIIYYRLPGFIAAIALVMYSLLSLALFKLIPVTLTLPGIAGFVLSIGMAVDANILIFERLKEELRAGRTLQNAIDLGWRRAWLSIRDSNISTLITCAILFWFGSNFGASLVKGFSLTLALGVLVSLFTALIVTRTFLHVVLDSIKFAEHPKWFGVQE
ncbi:MAG: protein translocase subunit SecD [Anaerolineaceae bacterium]